MPRPIAIIGRGRVGTSLAQAWSYARFEVTFTSTSRTPDPTGILILAVPDRAIATVASELAARPQRPWLVAHLSGSLGLEVLAPLAGPGIHLGSLHPLLAVFQKRASLARGWAAVDGDAVARRTLSRLARAAHLHVFRHAPHDRGRYHLGATLAANSLAPLLARATQLLVEAGIDEREAQAALPVLMLSALRGVSRLGPVEGLTGPIARGDAETVDRHLRALGSRPTTRSLYRALGLEALDLAKARQPPPPGLERIAKLLRATSLASRRRP